MSVLKKDAAVLRKKLDNLGASLAKLATEHLGLADKLKLFKDERWEWACKHILEPEKQRVAYARCAESPDAVIKGAIAQGQFEECKKLLELRAALELEDQEYVAAMQGIQAEMSKVEKAITNL